MYQIQLQKIGYFNIPKKITDLIMEIGLQFIYPPLSPNRFVLIFSHFSRLFLITNPVVMSVIYFLK